MQHKPLHRSDTTEAQWLQYSPLPNLYYFTFTNTNFFRRSVDLSCCVL